MGVTSNSLVDFGPLIWLVSTSSLDEYKVYRFKNDNSVMHFIPPRENDDWKIINAMHYLPKNRIVFGGGYHLKSHMENYCIFISIMTIVADANEFVQPTSY